MGSFVSFQPPDEYPNHLAVPQADRLRLPPSGWLLPVLVLLCLIPRAMMALRIPSVCPDGVLYVRIAQAIEAGDWQSASRDLGLNVYPLILAALHRAGLGWQLAGAVWGVTVSTLVVLPLWGWVRRQFDDRVALVACLLYAAHPKFIEWSPELMRDPTFWLLFMLGLYWLWRAVTELRYRCFMAAGATLVLASVVRVEGLFLLIPLALWSVWRFIALRTDRKRLLFGLMLALFVFPALAAAVGIGWALAHSGVTALRLGPLARIMPWLASTLGGAPLKPLPDQTDAPLGFAAMIWVFIPTMTRGLSPLFGLLMLGGVWGWRRLWARRDHQPLFYTAIVMLCGIWVQLWYDRTICPRYALPMVLTGSPFAALGLLGLTARLLRLSERLQWGLGRQRVVVAAVAALVAATGLADAMTSNGKYFQTRQAAVDLGCWMRTRCANPPTIVGPRDIAPITGFYANAGRCETFRWEADDASILAAVPRSGAAVVLLEPVKELTDERCAALAVRLKQAGLDRLDRAVLPASCDRLLVLARPELAAGLARQPSQTY